MQLHMQSCFVECETYNGCLLDALLSLVELYVRLFLSQVLDIYRSAESVEGGKELVEETAALRSKRIVHSWALATRLREEQAFYVHIVYFP